MPDMQRTRLTAALCLLLFAALLLGCGDADAPVVSEPEGTPRAVVEETIPLRSVNFRNGSFPEASTLVSVVLDADEVPLLEGFPQLKTADLSGSTCYAEILAYAEQHPEVNVIYTVDIGGTRVSPAAETAVAAGPADADTLLAAVSYLPNLTSLDVRACELDNASVRRIREALPEIALQYAVSYQGAVYDSDITSLDLSQLSAADVQGMTELFDLLPNLEYVNLTNQDNAAATVKCDITLDQVAALQQQYPDIGFDYAFTLFGRTFSTGAKLMDLSGINVGKSRLDQVRAWLPYMTVCEKVDMDGCNVPSEMMAALQDEFPDTKLVWRIRFTRYSCRTDAKVLRASTGNPRMTSKEMQVIKYCTELEMLDLGHNYQKDLSFVSNMPNLRVAILAMGYVSDISPLANCTKLEYLELFTNFIVDVSPLAELKELKHLNLTYNRITDISPLYGLTQLERLWIARNKYPPEQIEELIAALPNTEIDYTTHNPTGGTWRVHPRYDLLCEQFHYDMLADFVSE